MKVDISYLKELVVELETLLSEADLLKDSKSGNSERDEAFNKKFLVTMCKTAGVCMGITQEGSMLIGDIQKVIGSSFASPKAKEDAIEALLGNFNKSIKTTNNN
jgi:Mg2+ and Co2+ transporter CorA